MALTQPTYNLTNQGTDTSPLQPKALYAGDQFNGQPVLAVTDKSIVMAGSDTNAVRVDPDFGVLMSGKLSLSATPDQISIGGGYWRLNPLLLSCIPSTTGTPIPVLVRSTPEILDGFSSLKDQLGFLTSHSDIA